MFTSNIIKAQNRAPSISNTIYHKLSYSAASYTFNGKNVKIMLGFFFKGRLSYLASLSLILLLTNVTDALQQ